MPRRPRRVDAILDGRPYADLAALKAAADLPLSSDEIRQAMAAHPRIGEKPASGWARGEQSGVDNADAFAAANAEYEAKFGHVYLVCASGRSGEELLKISDPGWTTIRDRTGRRRAGTPQDRRTPTRESGDRVSLVTTHVLDTAAGRPAQGIAVRFETAEGKPIADGRTDDDGPSATSAPKPWRPAATGWSSTPAPTSARTRSSRRSR